MMPLVDLLMPHKSIALIGMSKNAGKTTVLNHLVSGFAACGMRLILTSIGRDGENTDVVTKTVKPRIFVPAGSIIITAEGLLLLCDVTREILDVTDFTTPMGRVVVARALSAGFVQLGGPSITAQMVELLKKTQIYGADKIIIDGAVSRKSPAAPDLADAAILCTGAAISQNMDEVISKTRHITQMYMLPQVSPAKNDICLPGAVTDNKILSLLSVPDLKSKRIIADDAGKIFISISAYEKFMTRHGSLAVKKRINLAAVTINPYSPYGINFNAGEFLKKMRAAIPIPVYNVAEKEGELC